MSQHHASRNWKGCALCKPHKRRGRGRSKRDPVSVVRFTGRTRRATRHDVRGQD